MLLARSGPWIKALQRQSKKTHLIKTLLLDKGLKETLDGSGWITIPNKTKTGI